MNLTYKIAKTNELNSCADISAESFFDYEYFTNYFPNDKKRRKLLHHLIRCEFKCNKDNDKAYIVKAMDGDTIAAVAMLCAPGYQKASDADYLMNGFIKCYLDYGMKTVDTWSKMDSDAGKKCHEHEGYWYLSLLTVNNDYKGKGVGTSFINDFITPFVLSHGSNQLCLFTNSEQNRRFYQKNGFEEFHEESFEYNGKVLGSWSYKKTLN